MERINEPAGPAGATLGEMDYLRGQQSSLGGQSGATGFESGLGGMTGPGDGNALAGIEQVQQGYDSLVDSILGGNRSAGDSIAQLFGSLSGGGKQAKQALAGVFEGMAGEIFSGMADYAKQLGILSGLSAKVFTALKSMNPFAAAAASIGLIALGVALKSLAGSVGGGGGSSSGSAGGSYTPSTASVSSSTASSAQPLSIYIGGLSGVSSYEVERTLDRAGVDRELRERFRELVRTGSNPALAY